MGNTSSRLGRPPASSSAETRARILDVARRKFATGGYEATSNRSLAEAAGLTTGAIYHYFDSKLDIYCAVQLEVQERVYARFQEAIGGPDTFASQLEAVLEAAHDLNCEDRTLAQFLGASRVDASRDSSLALALEAITSDVRAGFFSEMVELGVQTGEIDPTDREIVEIVIRTLTVGLTDAVSHDVKTHRAAVDGIKALIEGKLIKHTS